MMAKEIELRERLLGRPGKPMIEAIAADAVADEAMLAALFGFVYSGEDPLRWRAAWAIEKVTARYPQCVVGERSKMMQLCMQDNIPDGLRRLLLSILYSLATDSELDVDFYNFLLGRMCDLQSPPGVQSLAMTLACRMSRVDSDLQEEFLCILRNMEKDYYSAGLKSVLRNCLKRKKY